MSLVDEIFGNESPREKREYEVKIPFVTRDYKDSSEKVRFFFLEDFGTSAREIERAKTHRVPGVGRVVCPKKIMVEKKPDKDGNKVATGRFWEWDGRTERGTVNKNPEYNCPWCDEKRAFKNTLPKNDKGQMSREDSKKDQDLYKVDKTIYFPVCYEVYTEEGGKSKLKIERTKGWLPLRVGDALHEKGSGHWMKLLKAYKSGKYSGFWWVLDSDGTLEREDKVDSDDLVDMDLNREDLSPMHKSSNDGLKLWSERRSKADAGVEVLENLEKLKDSLDDSGDDIDDNDLPF